MTRPRLLVREERLAPTRGAASQPTSRTAMEDRSEAEALDVAAQLHANEEASKAKRNQLEVCVRGMCRWLVVCLL